MGRSRGVRKRRCLDRTTARVDRANSSSGWSASEEDIQERSTSEDEHPAPSRHGAESPRRRVRGRRGGRGRDRGRGGGCGRGGGRARPGSSDADDDIDAAGGSAGASHERPFGEAEVTQETRALLSQVHSLSKKPWTQTKYTSQLRKWQWFCDRDDDGEPREPPLDPSLATDDCLAKATNFLCWIARNAPGWSHPKKNSDAMGLSSLRQIHAAMQVKYKSDHIAANRTPPLPDLLKDVQYAAAYKRAKQAALPDKGERPNRDPQEGVAPAPTSGGRLLRNLQSQVNALTTDHEAVVFMSQIGRSHLSLAPPSHSMPLPSAQRPAPSAQRPAPSMPLLPPAAPSSSMFSSMAGRPAPSMPLPSAAAGTPLMSNLEQVAAAVEVLLAAASGAPAAVPASAAPPTLVGGAAREASSSQPDNSADCAAGLRSIPEARSFHSVKHFWDWSAAPHNGGPSVQQRESTGDISWRSGQRFHHQRWRGLSLVLQRVEALRQQNGRRLPPASGVAAADEEMVRLKLRLPGYIRHLERQTAAANKAAKDAARTDSTVQAPAPN